jgi:hypothetical protein
MAVSQKHQFDTLKYQSNNQIKEIFMSGKTQQPKTRKPKKEKVISVQVMIQECRPDGTLNPHGKVRSKVFNTVDDGISEDHVTSIYFNTNSIDRILAEYYQGNTKYKVNANSPIIKKGMKIPDASAPEGSRRINTNDLITPDMMRRYWEEDDVVMLVKCANSQIC